MPENIRQQESLEAVRLLWEGTRKALPEGIDTEALNALCGIIVRLADQRLLRLSHSPSSESEDVAGQLRHYRKMAADLLQWASAPTPEPDWPGIVQRLQSVGAPPLEPQDQPR